MPIKEPNCMPKIDMIKGTSQELLFIGVFDTTQYPFYFTGCSAEFALIHLFDLGGDPVIRKSMSVANDGLGGNKNALSVKLNPSDTADLAVGRYVYQVSIRDTYGCYEAAHGFFDLYHNIDKVYTTN